MHTQFSRPTALGAGLLYLAIIALGLTAEFAVRQPLIHPGDPAATAAAIAAAEPLFRFGILADAGMVLADVALAVTLFALFRSVAPLLSLYAMAFRLIQAAVLAAALLLPIGALAFADTAGVPLRLLELHAVAYDLGLLFFAVSTGLVSAILFRAGAPRWIAGLMGAAALTYLAGSTIRILAPGLVTAFEPAYAIALVAELSFTIWLLFQGRRRSKTQPALA